MLIRTPSQSLLQAPRQLAWVTDELPELGPHDLLLHTRAGAISLGTELPLYLEQSRGAHQPAYPCMTVYESVAEVIACGSAVRGISVGDRVVVFYGHCTATVVLEPRVLPIPPSIPEKLAVLLILACGTAKGASKVLLNLQSRVAITGSGTIVPLTSRQRIDGCREVAQSGRYALESVFEQTVDARALPVTFEQLAASNIRPLKVFVQYE